MPGAGLLHGAPRRQQPRRQRRRPLVRGGGDGDGDGDGEGGVRGQQGACRRNAAAWWWWWLSPSPRAPGLADCGHTCFTDYVKGLGLSVGSFGANQSRYYHLLSKVNCCWPAAAAFGGKKRRRDPYFHRSRLPQQPGCNANASVHTILDGGFWFFLTLA